MIRRRTRKGTWYPPLLVVGPRSYKFPQSSSSSSSNSLRSARKYKDREPSVVVPTPTWSHRKCKPKSGGLAQQVSACGTRCHPIRGGSEKGRHPPLLVVGTRSRAIRGGSEKGRDPSLLVVGTRSCAIRGGTSSEARNGRNSPVPSASSQGGKRKQASETCHLGSHRSASLPRAIADHVSVPRATPER